MPRSTAAFVVEGRRVVSEPTNDLLSAALDRITALEADVCDLRERLASVENVRGPNDQRIREQFANSVEGDGWFHSHDLMRRKRVDADLHAVLEAAGVTNVDELGTWLRGLRGVRFGVRVARRGRRWRVTREPRDLPSENDAIA